MSRKQSSLWDSDEDTPALKNVAAKALQELQLKDDGKIQKPRLFDGSGSDSDGPRPLNSKLQGNGVKPKPSQQTQKRVDSLFDSSDSEPQQHSAALHSATFTQPVDYKTLYEQEVAKCKVLEETVLALSLEVARLKQESVSKPGTLVTPKDTAEPADDDVKETADWSALAKEEKLRRQNKVHSLQSRQRAANLNKRLQVKGDGLDGLAHSVSTGSLQGAAAEPVPSAAVPAGLSSAQSAAAAEEAGEGGAGAVLGRGAAARNYLDSSDEESTEGDKKDSDATAVAAAVADIGAVSGASRRSGGDDAGLNDEGQDAAPADPAADAEAAKWRELAEQEKLRKAQARRSVRTVRRPAPGPAVGEGPPAIKQRPLRGAQYRPLQASVAALSVANAAGHTEGEVTGPGVTNTMSAPRSTERWDDESGSDWSSEDAGDDSDRARSVPSPLPVLPQQTRSEFPESGKAPAAAAGTGAAAEGPCGAEQEAQLDRRLRRWAAGKSVAALLSTVPTVLMESAAALGGLGEVEAAVAPLQNALASGGNGSAEIRKAYMYVLAFSPHTAVSARIDSHDARMYVYIYLLVLQEGDQDVPSGQAHGPAAALRRLPGAAEGLHGPLRGLQRLQGRCGVRGSIQIVHYIGHVHTGSSTASQCCDFDSIVQHEKKF